MPLIATLPRLTTPSPISRRFLSRSSFIGRLSAITGSPPIAGYVADSTDGATATCPWSGRVWTPEATMAGTIVALGRGYRRPMAAASSQYLTTPDTNNVSFGNGSNDSSLSWIALINTGDTAANKTLFSKFDNGTSQREYLITVTSAEVLSWQLIDQSAGVTVGLNSNAAVPLGAWILLGGSYDGGGGATAANGMVAYLNGAVLATSPTNNASYVAMENLTAPLEIGSLAAHTAQFFDGSMALVAIYTKTLTAAHHQAITAACRQFYGVPL